MDPRVERIQRLPFTIPAPAAGADISYRIGQAGQSYGPLGPIRLLSVVARLTTSAVVATRTVQWTIDDGTTVYMTGAAGATQAASLTDTYFAWPGNPGAAAGVGRIRLDWPHDPPVLYPGHTFKTVTDSIDVGDQWGVTAFLVEELPSGPYVAVYPSDSVYVESLVPDQNGGI